jgi:uncharacterized lipoprotein YehR (DUF1307 family)
MSGLLSCKQLALFQSIAAKLNGLHEFISYLYVSEKIKVQYCYNKIWLSSLQLCPLVSQAVPSYAA